MDCDMIVLQNMDSLMTLPLPSEEWIAAAHACTCNPRKIPTYPDDWSVLHNIETIAIQGSRLLTPGRPRSIDLILLQGPRELRVYRRTTPRGAHQPDPGTRYSTFQSIRLELFSPGPRASQFRSRPAAPLALGRFPSHPVHPDGPYRPDLQIPRSGRTGRGFSRQMEIAELVLQCPQDAAQGPPGCMEGRRGPVFTLHVSRSRRLVTRFPFAYIGHWLTAPSILFIATPSTQFG